MGIYQRSSIEDLCNFSSSKEAFSACSQSRPVKYLDSIPLQCNTFFFFPTGFTILEGRNFNPDKNISSENARLYSNICCCKLTGTKRLLERKKSGNFNIFGTAYPNTLA